MCVLLYVAMAMGVTSCCHLPLCQHSPQDSSLSYDLKVSFTNLIREHTYTHKHTHTRTRASMHTQSAQMHRVVVPVTMDSKSQL